LVMQLFRVFQDTAANQLLKDAVCKVGRYVKDAKSVFKARVVCSRVDKMSGLQLLYPPQPLEDRSIKKEFLVWFQGNRTMDWIMDELSNRGLEFLALAYESAHSTWHIPRLFLLRF